MMTSPSSLSMSSGLVNSILNMQTQLARSQKEMTSGTVADLGQALGANVGLDFSYGASNAMLTTIQATNGLVGSRLDVAQTALTSIQTDAQSLQSALLQASQPGGSSTGLATQAQDALSNLVSSLNTSIGGAYVFGGATTDAPPIAADPTTAGSAFQTAMASAITATFGSSAAAASATAATFQSNFTGVLSQVSAQGTTGQISLSSTTNPTSVTNVPTSVTANFVDPANPSTPVMQKLAEAYSLLSGASVQSLGQAGYDAALNVASTLVAQGVAGVTQMQAAAGQIQNNVNNANSTMAIQQTFFQTQIGNLEDVDQTQTATQINNLTTQIETAYQLTAKLQNMSLAQYL